VLQPFRYIQPQGKFLPLHEEPKASERYLRNSHYEANLRRPNEKRAYLHCLYTLPNLPSFLPSLPNPLPFSQTVPMGDLPSACSIPDAQETATPFQEAGLSTRDDNDDSGPFSDCIALHPADRLTGQ
jgi:hypothetical protein